MNKIIKHHQWPRPWLQFFASFMFATLFSCGFLQAPKAPEANHEVKIVSCLCPQIFEPQCGVDGKTYGNKCEVECQKIAIKHDGPCDQDRPSGKKP